MSTRAYNPDIDPTPETVSHGPTGESTNRDYRKEDREAEESDLSGRIPRAEVNDLREDGAQTIDQRTRGKKVDAYKAERDLDAALEAEGALDDERGSV